MGSSTSTSHCDLRERGARAWWIGTTSREVALHFDPEPGYIASLIQTASLLYWSLAILIVAAVFISAPILVGQWINLRTTDAGTFSNLSAAGEHKALIRQFRKLQELVCFVTAPMFAAICFAAAPVYAYLFNSSVAGRLLVPTILLAVGFYMNSALNPPFMLSFAVGKPQIVVRANVVALFLVLPVTVLLIAAYGLTGAAASWVFYNLFAYVYIVPKICWESLQIPTWSWYRRVLTSGGLAVIAYGLSWFLIASAGSFSLSALFVAYVAGSLVFAVGAYLLIDSDVRNTFLRLTRTLTVPKGKADPQPPAAS